MVNLKKGEASPELGNELNSRREFMRQSAFAAGVVALTVCGGCALFQHRETADLKFEKGANELRIPRSNASQLSKPGGAFRLVREDDGLRIIVVRLPEGELRALSMECTHLGSDVGYVLAERRFACPSHGSLYDEGGEVVEGPADESLKKYPIVEEDGYFVITLG